MTLESSVLPECKPQPDQTLSRLVNYLACDVGLEETKTAISQKQPHKQALRGFSLMWTPRLLRSQSGGLFLEVVSEAQFGQQMVFERELGAIYSKQIFYPWQVMERATTVWRFNKSAQTNCGRTRLK